MKQFVQTTLALFVCFCIIFIPFPYVVFSFPGFLSEMLFNDLLLFMAQHLFNQERVVPQVSSDSVLMYLLVLVLFVLAACITPFVRNKDGIYWQRIVKLINITGCCYLALHLAKYGFDKLFKAQFYQPEPNILYTPFGQLDQDILYWSTMGTSYSYSLFLGAAEICASVLLLFNRTRILGLLAAWVLMLNIVAVNFSFNISVKLFSLFLFLVATWLLTPYFRNLYHVLVLRSNVVNKKPEPIVPFIAHPFWKATIKTAVILIIITESVYPHLQRSNINDDKLARPFLHGAYRVTGNTGSGEYAGARRLFIHRKGYFIIEYGSGEMKDYKLDINQPGRQFTITDYQHNQTQIGYSYYAADSILTLIQPGDTLPFLRAKALDWKSLPALQPVFQWTTDGH
jgi:hypothetical protein